jgi:hypothetical protein
METENIIFLIEVMGLLIGLLMILLPILIIMLY